jgi:hypothetical protein
VEKLGKGGQGIIYDYLGKYCIKFNKFPNFEEDEIDSEGRKTYFENFEFI